MHGLVELEEKSEEEELELMFKEDYNSLHP